MMRRDPSRNGGLPATRTAAMRFRVRRTRIQEREPGTSSIGAQREATARSARVTHLAEDDGRFPAPHIDSDDRFIDPRRRPPRRARGSDLPSRHQRSRPSCSGIETVFVIAGRARVRPARRPTRRWTRRAWHEHARVTTLRRYTRLKPCERRVRLLCSHSWAKRRYTLAEKDFITRTRLFTPRSVCNRRLMSSGHRRRAIDPAAARHHAGHLCHRGSRTRRHGTPIPMAHT